MILCISVVLVVTSPFSFLILLVWGLCILFLMSQAKGVSIFLIFSKNQFLVSFIFPIVILNHSWFLVQNYLLFKSMWKFNELTQFSSIQLLSRVQHFVTPWTAAHKSSLFITNSQNLLNSCLTSVMPSNHLILCRPLLLLPSIFLSQDLFQWVSSSHQVAKVLEFQLQHQSFQWIFRTDLL